MNAAFAHGAESTRPGWCWLGGAATALPLVLAAALAGCGASDAPPPAASIALPSYPFTENASIVVDVDAIERAGGRYCRAAGTDANAVEFFLGSLPLTGIDRICGGATSFPEAEPILGELYLSGYFGGLWLRDSLLADGSRAAVAARRTTPAVGAASVVEDAVFAALVDFAGARLSRARADGDEAGLLQAAGDSLPLLLTLYGYNFGYLEVAEENPPPGLAPPASAVDCGSFLGCRGTSVDLALLDRYAQALRSIEAPPTPEWSAIAAQVQRFGEGSVEAGRGVWEGILGGSSIAPGAYLPLLDLSAGYLLVSEAAVLANARAAAERDVDAARCGALVETGLLVWSGSYFEGLAASAAPGTFPSFSC